MIYIVRFTILGRVVFINSIHSHLVSIFFKQNNSTTLDDRCATLLASKVIRSIIFTLLCSIKSDNYYVVSIIISMIIIYWIFLFQCWSYNLCRIISIRSLYANLGIIYFKCCNVNFIGCHYASLCVSIVYCFDVY